MSKKKEDKAAELTATLQRLQADFENYKKQQEKRNGQLMEYATQGLVTRMLVVLDEFELALKHTENREDFVKGMAMVYENFRKILEKEGLRPIEALGKQFDPYRHEVLLQEHSDKDEGCVLQELQKGYYFKDKVIRHSKVTICKRGEEKCQQA
jgi:molecular chaperone GrpE